MHKLNIFSFPVSVQCRQVPLNTVINDFDTDNLMMQAMEQAEQDPDLRRSASNVLGKFQSHLCLTEWRGK